MVTKAIVWLSVLCSNVVLIKTLGRHLKRRTYPEYTAKNSEPAISRLKQYFIVHIVHGF